jgi:hypothetical protein
MDGVVCYQHSLHDMVKLQPDHNCIGTPFFFTIRWCHLRINLLQFQNVLIAYAKDVFVFMYPWVLNIATHVRTMCLKQIFHCLGYSLFNQTIFESKHVS